MKKYISLMSKQTMNTVDINKIPQLMAQKVIVFFTFFSLMALSWLLYAAYTAYAVETSWAGLGELDQYATLYRQCWEESWEKVY